MKFWQKAFLGILAAFIVCINVCLFLLSNYSDSLNFKRDSDRAAGEYHAIMNGVYASMRSIALRSQDAPDSASLYSLMRSYADFYIKQGVTMELRHAGTVLFSNLPPSAASSLGDTVPSGDTYSVRRLTGNRTEYLSITGRVAGQFQDYALICLRDLSELHETHGKLTGYLIAVSGAAEILLALALFFILKSLTHPIDVLQKATRRIAGGMFDERIALRGHDEFRDLSESFNQMADSIQTKLDELDKNARDKQRLIDNLAHELRTPLTTIRGYAEYLRNASTSEENRIVAAGYIIGETDRLKNLAFKLLDLALVRNNKPALTVIAPLDAFLNSVAESARPKLVEKNVTLSISCSLNELTADEVLLHALLLNLIDNARNASEPGSDISLSAYVEEVPVLEVRDSGCGMNAEQVALACEPFYRADKARSRSSGGVGLGLALVREIVRLHGAEIEIASEPGHGTTVRIVFTTSLQLSENSEIS